MTVLEKKKDGWWRGEKDGHTGYFPSNFVSEGDVSPTTPTQTTGTIGVKFGSYTGWPRSQKVLKFDIILRCVFGSFFRATL